MHYTAKANITRTIGQQVELKASEIQSTDSTDYLLGGSLVVKNGKIDRYLFDGGYAQATASGTTDNFAFFYQNKDHLGTVRETVTSTGAMKQRVNYYPFGGQLVDTLKAMVLSPNFQQYKYNGKEFDNMYGLNTYDYGARQHYPVLARWDRIDPLCEKYYGISPYAYCGNNPVNSVDPDGMDDYKINADGYLELWRKTKAKETDRVFASDTKSYITIGKKTTTQLMTDRDDYNGNYAEGGSEMVDLFYFVSNNTNVEWKLNGYKGENGDTYLLATSHKEDKVTNTDGGNDKLDLFVSFHNHPGDSPAKASGYGKNSTQSGKIYSIGGDDQFAVNEVYNRFKDANKAYPSGYPKFYIYHPKTHTRIGYDPFKPRTSVKKINNSSDLIK